MNERTVLISGAGIGGSTLAYWLARHGFRPTVVEHARRMRSSGSPVDVRGPAVEVADRMGIMPRLRAAGTGVTGMRFVNAAGRRVGRVGMRVVQGGTGEVELPRHALASVLYEAGRDHAEFVFDDAIASLEQDERGVNVTFDHGEPRRFDLVVGADGLHSNVRRLAFGPEPGFVRHMGLYVATTPFHGPIEHPHEVVLHNAPGRLAAIHPSPTGPLAFFAFRSPAVPDFDHRDAAQHRRLLAAAYADVGWRVPELLERVRTAEDLYFDSVSQVRLNPWSDGRIALVGDAASSLSLFGDGSTLAIAGAFTLAGELAASPGDHRSAFRRYEAAHRTLVEPRQRNAGAASSMLIPATRGGILARNLATRLSPLVAAAGRLRRPARSVIPRADVSS
jgi:2-polyprenyl-6-methoxyphenol hydroxylase-like FAD-dependent oxidoreductase